MAVGLYKEIPERKFLLTGYNLKKIETKICISRFSLWVPLYAASNTTKKMGGKQLLLECNHG